jgi:hypothetical protein
MAETETIRIAKMDEDERTIVNVLSPKERKEALLKAGQFKIQNANNRLLTKQLLETPNFAEDIQLWLEEIGRSLEEAVEILRRHGKIKE